MTKRMLIFGICALVLLAVFNIGCFEDDKEEEKKDTDGDGVFDEEDDYPNDGNYTALLEVTKLKEYIKEGLSIELLFEFRNDRDYAIDKIKISVTFYYTTTNPYTLDNREWSGNVLKPGEKAISSAHLSTNYEIESWKIVIKARKGGDDWLKPDVVILSDSLSGDTVSVNMKNNGTESVTVETWIAYFNANGQFLDIYEGVFSTQLAPGETGTKNVESSRGPVSTYDIYLKFV